MRFDPAASMRCWGVTVEIGGRDYRIPPHPAAVWLPAIVAPSLRPIVPGMVVGLAVDDLLDQMEAGAVSVTEMDRAARDAIGEVAGMKWWAAARLSGWLWGNWDSIGGLLMSRGIDMGAIPLGAVLVAAYRIIQENRKDEAERRKIDLELDKPPVNSGVAVEEMFDQKAATQSFMALLGSGTQ